MLSGEGATKMQGTGGVNRQEKIELTVAAMVTNILPNGNLVISGRQEVRVNNELRELTVAGIIRPEDISAENTIRNDQIAEARISYGGRGVVSAMQKPGWGQRVGDAVAPF
jgi:flagellar L-ring protein precursor FlgH